MPFSDYRFRAPISYRGRAFHAREYFWISHTLLAGLLLVWLLSSLKRALWTPEDQAAFRGRGFKIRV